jgi:hypothetical protein
MPRAHPSAWIDDDAADFHSPTERDPLATGWRNVVGVPQRPASLTSHE